MPTNTILTDEFNDLYLPDGKNLSIIGGVDACSQSITQAVRMRLGEDIYNVGTGVDYFGYIFTATPNYDAARQSISNAIKGVAEVTGINSLVISIDGNTLNYTAEVSTTYGTITVRNL